MKVLLLTAARILGVSAIFLPLVTSAPAAQTSAAIAPGASLGPVDTYFVTQTSQGTPFQVDSGRLAQPRVRPKPFGAMRTSWWAPTSP